MKQKLLYGFLLLFVGLTCNMRAWALEQDEAGVYQIGNAADLVAFSNLVNAGEFGANAVLTADINMAEEIAETGWTAIGDWGGISGTSSACYKGHFDGQGHTISGFNTAATHNAIVFGLKLAPSMAATTQNHGVIRIGNPNSRNFKSYGVG